MALIQRAIRLFVLRTYSLLYKCLAAMIIFLGVYACGAALIITLTIPTSSESANLLSTATTITTTTNDPTLHLQRQLLPPTLGPIIVVAFYGILSSILHLLFLALMLSRTFEASTAHLWRIDEEPATVVVTSPNHRRGGGHNQDSEIKEELRFKLRAQFRQWSSIYMGLLVIIDICIVIVLGLQFLGGAVAVLYGGEAGKYYCFYKDFMNVVHNYSP